MRFVTGQWISLDLCSSGEQAYGGWGVPRRAPQSPCAREQKPCVPDAVPYQGAACDAAAPIWC